MADSRFEFDADAMENILRAVDKAFETKLGPQMEAEVKKNTPIDTGALIDSVKYSVDRTEHTLIVQAYGDEERAAENRKYYAAWVDLGHRIIAWGHDTGRVQPPTAFMRRALYRRYGGF